jgi:hypothetical protein
MVPVVRRLLDPLMGAPSKLLGAGPVVATDLRANAAFLGRLPDTRARVAPRG